MTPTLRDLFRLVEWLQSEEAYKWLPYDSWLSGGCWLLGEALLRILPGSSIWWVTDSSGKPQHAVVRYQRYLIDGDGVHHEAGLLYYWEEEEGLEDPYLTQQPDRGYLESLDLVCPADLVNELVEKLQSILEGKKRRAFTLRTASKLNMFHGTCTGPDGRILHSILKEGLKPDPKEKAYKSPYPEDDEDDFYELEFSTEVTMRLDESLGGAYLTTDVEEAKRYAQNACTEHGGDPVLVMARIETRSPHIKIDEDFLVNYVWEFVVADFDAEDEDKYYLELFKWIDEGDVDWEDIAKGWIKQQFPQARISEHRWKQILPAAGQMIRDIMIITFLQHHEQEAASEAYGSDEYWEVDAWYEIQDSIESFKENIEFVTDKLNEVTEPPKGYGMHNVRSLEPVGYRGSNRILAVISWQSHYYVDSSEYDQLGTVYYARTTQDAKFLMGASRVLGTYSKWTSPDGSVVYYDNPKPKEKAVACVVAGAVYRLADTPVVGEVFAGDQHLGFLVAKNKKLLNAEAQRIYEWSRQDHETYYADEPFGELRVESRFVGIPGVEGIIEEWYRYGEMEQTMESALAEYEEKGVLQA